MRMFTVDKSTGPGLEDRRTRLWKHADVGVNRFTELDLDLPELENVISEIGFFGGHKYLFVGT